MEAERITRALRGRWHGRYGVACCPAHDDKNPSLSLANGPSGRLLLHCHAGCSFEAILGALRGLGLVEGGRGDYRPPTQVEQSWQRVEELREARKRANQARVIWDEAKPISGTPAEAYLRGRGVACDLPASLGFHPACWHGPSARKLPALVALVTGTWFPAVHRTFVDPDGLGKAGVSPNKMMLGNVSGGHVELASAEGDLVVCEGLETGLSLASGLLRAPATIWAALSASGMRSVLLPDQPHRLTIATDGDDPGRAAGHQLATRAAAMGWTVGLLPAPDGQDWNDVVQAKGSTA